MVSAYIDDILVHLKKNFKDHLNSLNKVLQILTEAVVNSNLIKLLFGQTEMEYIGFWIHKK